MMKIALFCSLAALTLIASAPVLAQAPERAIRFAPGATSTSLKGSIRGDRDATYTLQTVDGQVLQSLFKASNKSCYFNVFDPGSQEAAHNGSISGNEFGRSPTKAGAYRFQIYLMRNASRRNEACRYELAIELTGKPGGASPGVSERQMRDACRAKVASMYAVPTTRIRLAATRNGKDAPLINGTVNKGAEGVKKFRCLYTPERQLRDVMAMTPDGN